MQGSDDPVTPPDGEPEVEPYANIRQILGHLIGRRIVDITQHDKADFVERGEYFVQILLDDGNYLKFLVPADGGFQDGREDSDVE